MNEIPAPVFALPSGLPKGPWRKVKKGEFWAVTPSGSTRLIATAYSEEGACAIVAIPSMMEEIERYRKTLTPEGILALEVYDENVRLHAEIERLNREINEALQLTECCSTLKDMASACIDGTLWKLRAEKAEALNAEIEEKLAHEKNQTDCEAERAALAKAKDKQP